MAIFSGLDDSVLERIGRLMVAREVKKHEIIWLEQEPARMIYFVASGLIKLFKTSMAAKSKSCGWRARAIVSAMPAP